MKAIVFTSNTGFTARYAEMLGKKTGLPVYELDRSDSALEKGTPILYMGWLFAGSVKGYAKASKRYCVEAVCGVGLCDTGCLLEEVRKTISLPAHIPLFTVQGGMDRSKLRGVNKFMIAMLTKFMAAKKDPTEDDKRMVELLTTDASYVKEAHLEALLNWFEAEKSDG